MRETEVLEPLAPTIRDETDSWPEFSLKHTRVLSQSTGKIVSLLEANRDHLVRVEGDLDEVDEDQRKLLRIPNHRNRSIILEDVAIYSFSQFDDGTFGFWAGGKAGWFEVKQPLKSFQNAYEGMNEATKMFYFLADKCKNSRKSFLKATPKEVDIHVKQLFNAYFTNANCAESSFYKVQRGFYHHRLFLIKSMLEGQEGVDWNSSSIFHHLKRVFPVEFTSCETVVSKAHVIGVDKAAASLTESSQPSEVRQSSNENIVPSSTKLSKTEKAQMAATQEQESDRESLEEDSKDRYGSINPRKRKSNLRPKSNKSAKKGTGRREPVRSDQKEQQSNVNGAHNSQTPTAESSIEENSTPQSDVLSAPHVTPLVLTGQKNSLRKKEGAPQMTFVQEPLPSYYVPRGPGDTWICPYDGCNQRVYQAKEAYAVQMIKNHFAKIHAGKAEDLINQEARPWISAE
ncbi:hypothetical protein MMC06_000371 [Schaereria dolodes]|nr:hypothetical protein [Schaereria dolodes]